VLHAPRDRLPVQETADLAAQLPVLIRGIYYEGWDPARVPMKMSRDGFTARVRRYAQATTLLRDHRDQLDALVDALLVHETLDESEAYAIAGVPSRADVPQPV